MRGIAGIAVIVVCIAVAISLASVTNPFDEKLMRILYSAVSGGVGGLIGCMLSAKLNQKK